MILILLPIRGGYWSRHEWIEQSHGEDNVSVDNLSLVYIVGRVATSSNSVDDSESV